MCLLSATTVLKVSRPQAAIEQRKYTSLPSEDRVYNGRPWLSCAVGRPALFSFGLAAAPPTVRLAFVLLLVVGPTLEVPLAWCWKLMAKPFVRRAS